jgi:putative heme-binding domain-containing protein
MHQMTFGPVLLLVVMLSSNLLAAQTVTLEQRLLDEGASSLASAARQHGDPKRGAVLFYQQYMSCRQCHRHDETTRPLGPDLRRLNQNAETRRTGDQLVESILQPSKVIQQGYETAVVVTHEGRTWTGLLVERNDDQVVIRLASPPGQQHVFAIDDLETVQTSKTSLMPAGLVNQLASRQQFLDLARYVIEIVEGGTRRARELEPLPTLYATPSLPEYEQHVDHAGMLRDLDGESFQRGRAVYERLCINCHGTHDQPGSLPTSLRFAQGKFKNGKDPLTMYHTLTRGFGMMVPQAWMVPQQKYDVIHYIREAYLKDANSSEYFEVTEQYLAGLPAGDTRGPEPSNITPWRQMDYGPNLIATYEVGEDGTNFAYKGNAIRLDSGPGGVSQGHAWIVYDLDTLRVAAAWSGDGFIDWNGINFNDRHNVHPRIIGRVELANPTGPGWSGPAGRGFSEVRLRGRDDRPYGPLPRPWAHYKGMHYQGQQIIVSYTVGDTMVREMPTVEQRDDRWIFQRIFNVGPREHDLVLQVAHINDADEFELNSAGDSDQSVLFGRTSETDANVLASGMVAAPPGSTWSTEGGDLRLTIPRGREPWQFSLWFSRLLDGDDPQMVLASLQPAPQPRDLQHLLDGGPPRWPERVTSPVSLGDDGHPLTADVLHHPVQNPWFCRLRLTGIDFFPDGDRAAVCAWDGSVWLIRGLASLASENDGSSAAPLTWQRIASGLFQPLGIKILDEKMYVTCRDQICILHDLNGDDEIDYYENFNNDHQVTEHFHEFAMGLQADADRNLYYAKSARHALTAIVPHHGTLLRVAADGSRTDILATGFRAANGVCLNPDGTFIVTDQEGHWNPKNRINWVHKGGFYGNMFGYHDVTDSSDEAMENPLCWITNAFDRSPAELLWVDSPTWKPLHGRLLNMSYGYGKLYVVPFEDVDGQKQGGMSPLPLPDFPTGLIRGRFHPDDGQLYVCGMFAWAGSQPQPGGLYRIRYTGKPLHVPVELNALPQQLRIGFTEPIDRDAAEDPDSYDINVWSLKRTANYGSDHYDERRLRVTSAQLEANGKSVRLTIPDLAPTWCMSIRYRLASPEGERIDGVIHNTIHALREE